MFWLEEDGCFFRGGFGGAVSFFFLFLLFLLFLLGGGEIGWEGTVADVCVGSSRRGMAALAGKDVKKLKGRGGGKWKYMGEKEMLEMAAPFAPYRLVLLGSVQ